MTSNKILLATLLSVFFSLSSFSQTTSKSIHLKVKEFSTLASEYVKTGKTDALKMSTLADEINCMLTLEQATAIMPVFVENKIRGRACGSNDYPSTAVLNQESVMKYKASIESMYKK